MLIAVFILIVTGKFTFVYAKKIKLFKPAFGINDVLRKKRIKIRNKALLTVPLRRALFLIFIGFFLREMKNSSS